MTTSYYIFLLYSRLLTSIIIVSTNQILFYLLLFYLPICSILERTRDNTMEVCGNGILFYDILLSSHQSYSVLFQIIWFYSFLFWIGLQTTDKKMEVCGNDPSKVVSSITSSLLTSLESLLTAGKGRCCACIPSLCVCVRWREEERPRCLKNGEGNYDGFKNRVLARGAGLFRRANSGAFW